MGEHRVRGIWTRATALVLGVCALVVAPAAADAAVKHRVTTVRGVKVDRYAWQDAKGRTRTVSLKQEGHGNPGHGGYAIQMTYQARIDGRRRTVVANAAPNEGWGYFVSHEAYRNYTDGTSAPIAQKIFAADDSPLGRGFPVTSTALRGDEPRRDAHRFRLRYPRYGTVAAHAPGDVLPLNPAHYRKYTLPVSVTWHFQTGKNFPRVNTTVDLSRVGAPDRVLFDVRGPYGVLDFDRGDNAISEVTWGDRFLFSTLNSPVTRNSGWTWAQANPGARFTALAAGAYEMGLFEPRPYSRSALDHGYSDNRGRHSSEAGAGCPASGWLLPCDWEWPYQSAQYSLPYDDNTQPTTGEKIAWGSAPLYGAAKETVPMVFDSPTHGSPFNGYPSSGRISYGVCVVLGRSIDGGLTRAVASKAPYSCPTR